MDFPTATEPAMPRTNGVVVSGSSRNRLVAAPSCLRRARVQAQQPAERKIDLTHLVDVETIAEPTHLLDLGLGEWLLRRRARGEPSRIA